MLWKKQIIYWQRLSNHVIMFEMKEFSREPESETEIADSIKQIYLGTKQTNSSNMLLLI